MKPRTRDDISAQRDARYMLRMVSKCTLYMIPFERLINALTREHSVAVRVNGSDSASCIWNRVKMALIRRGRSAEFG